MLAAVPQGIVTPLASDAAAVAFGEATEITAAQASGDHAGAGHSLVFVESDVPGYQQLSAIAAQAGYATYVLDAATNGVEAISRVLQNQRGIAAVHILSHGAPGAVSLGAVALTASTLEQFGSEISQWRTGLTPGADILLYGCNVAAGPDGAAFVAAMNRLTSPPRPPPRAPAPLAAIGFSKRPSGSSRQGLSRRT